MNILHRKSFYFPFKLLAHDPYETDLVLLLVLPVAKGHWGTLATHEGSPILAYCSILEIGLV